MQRIQKLLESLGAGRNYVGFYQTARAVLLILEDESRLGAVTKNVFEVIAKEYGCSRQAVERNIRTVIRRVWLMNPHFLSSISRYPLTTAPTIVEFLDILSLYLLYSDSSAS